MMSLTTTRQRVRAQNRPTRLQHLRRSLLLAGLIMLTSAAQAVVDEPPCDTVRAAAAAASMPGSYRLLSDEGIIRFPFEVFRGDIRYRCTVNGQDVYMLLDDGFLWDDLLFWGSPRVDSLGLEYAGEMEISGGPGDAKAITSKMASGITLGLPGVEFIDQTAVVTPYSSGASDKWWGSVGQASATFFKHFVVDINFDDMMIKLIEPEKFEYRGRGVEIPWTPMGFGPRSIPGTLVLADGRRISMEFMMDLGYNDPLRIVTKGEHNITVPDPALPTSLGVNIQGVETRGHAGRVPQVIIGGYEVRNVVVGFISEEHRDHQFHEAMIGLDLLSRFNLVFDYHGQRLFVEPNNTFDDPFEFDMSGMVLIRGGDDYLEIARINPDSPASDAGLAAGDRIIRINGRPAAGYDIAALGDLLRQPGTSVTLVVSRGDTEREVPITLRRLI